MDQVKRGQLYLYAETGVLVRITDVWSSGKLVWSVVDPKKKVEGYGFGSMPVENFIKVFQRVETNDPAEKKSYGRVDRRK